MFKKTGKFHQLKLIAAFITLVFGAIINANKIQAAPTNNPLPLEIVWQNNFYSVDSKSGDGRTNSEFVIKNNTNKTVTLEKFSIYFNCMAGALSSPDSDAIIEHVNGTFYKITPKSETLIIPKNGEHHLKMMHEDLVQTMSKTPTGPFLVFSSNPSKGLNFAKFTRIPLERSLKPKGAPVGFSTLKTSEAIFDENLKIENIAVSDLPPVFPLPLSYQYEGGKIEIATRPDYEIDSDLSSLKPRLDAVFRSIKKKPMVKASKIRIRIGAIKGQTSKEAYSLKIDKEGIEIVGNSKAGVFYGLQSLAQIVQANTYSNGLVLNYLEIIDAPRFEYRGLLIDIARNFKSKEKLHQTLELMALLKLNKLHLHLSDDEGWRLEIKSIPELTQIGAKRGYSNSPYDMLSPAYGSGPDAKKIGGSGYYTQEDYIELLKHAAALNIEIIPEIEMPGHARAAVKAMEARYHNLNAKNSMAAGEFLLSDMEDASKYRSAQLYSDNVINPALESTYFFADRVIGEIARMHKAGGVPLQRIHLGADELGNGAWEKSPAVLKLMKQLQTDKTADVWDYYYERMNEIAAKYGANIAGWEELGMRKLPKGSNPRIVPNSHFTNKGFLLFIWNNLDGSEDWAYQLANLGYDIVLAPVTNLYFDMMHQRDASEPGHDWSRAIDLKEVFDFDPYGMIAGIDNAQALKEDAKKHIKGIEATMFSETMMNSDLHDYLLTPRIFGLAERAWSKAPEWQNGKDNRSYDFSRFMNQLSKQFLTRISVEFPSINYRMPAPGAKVLGGKVVANYQYPGFEMRYTTNGSIPNFKSNLYTGPINDKAIIKIAAFSPNGRISSITQIDNR